MGRRPPEQTRSITECLPAHGKLSELLARARRLQTIDRLLPSVLGLAEASGLRAVHLGERHVTLGTDAPGRAYRLRYAKPRLLEAIRKLPGLAAVERIEVRTLASMPGDVVSPDASVPSATPSRHPPDAAALRSAAAGCTDPGLREILERLARHGAGRGQD
jgi:hypothetical protein